MPTRPARSSRATVRLALGDAAVLTPAQAAQLLPIGDTEARAWLHEAGLVRLLRGREVVIWGDVLQALRDAPTTTEPTAPPPRARAWREADY